MEMLTIRRVPTVVSMNQELEQGGCGRVCLGACCISASKLPLYRSGKKTVGGVEGKVASDAVPDAGGSPRTVLDSENVFLDTVILGQWEERMGRGLFRYDVTACETKILPGRMGFIAQLNEGRHSKKRPTEFRVDQVLQPFDPKKFNFTKVGLEEVLFCFEEGETEGSLYYEEMEIKGSPNVVVINVSPIDYGHVLLVPRVLDCLPQRIDEETFLLALQMAVEGDNEYFRVAYNSLGAYATINHLHFQAYYNQTRFPVERAATTELPSLVGPSYRTVQVFELCDYPVKAIVFELHKSVEDLANVVAKSCIELQERNIPFNLLISDRGSRVFLFPQCFAERQARGEVDQDILDMQVNPAAWEISGHIVLKRNLDYDTATEEHACRLLAEVSLSKEAFEEVKMICMTVAGGMDGFVVPPLMDVYASATREMKAVGSFQQTIAC